MDTAESLSHTKWECKDHVVLVPRCRRKTLYQELLRHLGKYFDGWPSRRRGRLKKGIDSRITWI
jgi:putative transposase